MRLNWILASNLILIFSLNASASEPCLNLEAFFSKLHTLSPQTKFKSKTTQIDIQGPSVSQRYREEVLNTLYNDTEGELSEFLKRRGSGIAQKGCERVVQTTADGAQKILKIVQYTPRRVTLEASDEATARSTPASTITMELLGDPRRPLGMRVESKYSASSPWVKFSGLGEVHPIVYSEEMRWDQRDKIAVSKTLSQMLSSYTQHHHAAPGRSFGSR